MKPYWSDKIHPKPQKKTEPNCDKEKKQNKAKQTEFSSLWANSKDNNQSWMLLTLDVFVIWRLYVWCIEISIYGTLKSWNPYMWYISYLAYYKF